MKTKAQFAEDLAGSAFSGTSAYKVGCEPIPSFAVPGWPGYQQLLGQGGAGHKVIPALRSLWLYSASHRTHTSACPQRPIGVCLPRALAEWPHAPQT